MSLNGFWDLRDILSGCRYPEKISICLDTCHVFAAGYDIRDEESYQMTMQSFSAVIGLERLKVIHLNDSKRELGSRVDRHEHIGLGAIGKLAFRLIMNDERLVFVPKVLETPKGVDESWDLRNLRNLRAMLDTHTG